MAALIGNIIQKKNKENPVNFNIDSQSSENKENEDHEGFQMEFSQTSQYTRMIENEIYAGNSFSQDQDLGLKKPSFQLSKYLGDPKKRGRDEADPPLVVHETLRKSHTMDNPMLQGLEEQEEENDMYADYGDNLWSANDLPEDSVKLLSLTQKPTTGKKFKNYKPEKNSTGANILIGLLKFESETKKKYATKKEIKQALKNAKEELGDLLISNWSAMNTLIKYDLVSNFQFSDEEKYSLTDSGFQTATDCYVKKIEDKQNPEPVAATNPSSTTAKDFKNPDAMNIESNSSPIQTSNSNSNSATTVDLNNAGSENKDVEFFDYSKFDFSKTVKKSQTKTVLKRSFTEEKVIITHKEKETTENTVSFSLFERLSTEKEKAAVARFTEIEQDEVYEKETPHKNFDKETPYKNDEKEEKESTEIYNHLVEKSIFFNRKIINFIMK